MPQEKNGVKPGETGLNAIWKGVMAHGDAGELAMT